MSEFMNCPFCGSQPEVREWSMHNYTCINCEVCGFEWYFFPTREAAISAWNTRAGDAK